MMVKSKCQNSKRKAHLILTIGYRLLTICAYVFVITPLYAKEITVIYTGSTHAMIYPCDCPFEPDGGVARRAALIKRLKKDYPEGLLVLDSGSFFAGGLSDDYTQNTQLDSKRTVINLKAMELMQYDAVNIGDDEFNFGRDFLQENIAKVNPAFLSCNVKADKVLPYIIKEVSGVKIGIVGVTPLSARQKAAGLEFIEPKAAVTSAIAELRKKGAGIIILLSRLSEGEDLNLINDIKGIDIIIAGYSRSKKEDSSRKVGNTVILRPFWQGKILGKASFTIEANKVMGYKLQELRLSDKVPDDPDILSILPACFSDINCKRQGYTGVCQNAGGIDARCLFSEANKIKLLIITPKDCEVCDTETTVNFLKRQFPGLSVSYLYYPGKLADKRIKNLAISGLPAYLLGKEIEKEKNFAGLKEKVELKNDFYILKPQFSGTAYFLDRQKIKGRLDLFISLYDKNTPQLLEAIKGLDPDIHFLAAEQEGKFDAMGGRIEIEEYLRAVCVKKYYPQNFLGYISCRSKNTETCWWEDCLANIDSDKIKVCAKASEGSSLLRENTSLNKELRVMFGPAYLLDNQKIFSTKGVPTKEGLEKILKK